MLLEKPIFQLTSVIFSGFSVILGLCITDVGFGSGYKITGTFGYFSVNRPTSYLAWYWRRRQLINKQVSQSIR